MELNVFRTAVPPCMGFKLEAALASKLVVEPPPNSAASVEPGVLLELNANIENNNSNVNAGGEQEQQPQQLKSVSEC